MINFEKYRHLTPHQHREIKKYDWVTVLSPDAMNLLKGLLRERERTKDEDARTLVSKLTDQEFATIVEALTVFDMANLAEKRPPGRGKAGGGGQGVSMS